MLSRVHQGKTLLISGSFWRESKSVIARSYASAAQATMAFGPSLEEMRTTAKQSFYTTTAMSPLASPYLNPDGHPSPQPYPSNVMTDSYSEQTIGTSSVLCLVYLFSLTVYVCCLRKNSRCACLPRHCRFSTIAIEDRSTTLSSSSLFRRGGNQQRWISKHRNCTRYDHRRSWRIYCCSQRGA